MEYRWWGLSECELDTVLYNILAPFTLTDHTYQDWEDFKQQEPHLAYAWIVETRFRNIEESILALRTILQMLGVDSFPIPSSVRPIDRYVWLRAIIDLALFRITVIRDCCYFLVAEIFELEINPHNLSLRTLLRQRELQGTAIFDALSDIASIGQSLRTERNQRAHQGIQREFGKDSYETFIFKMAATAEELGKGKIEDFDLTEEYSQQILVLYEMYVAEVEALQAKVLELQEHLVDPFYSRFKEKEASKVYADSSSTRPL